jgi:hypothetical protein
VEDEEIEAVDPVCSGRRRRSSGSRRRSSMAMPGSLRRRRRRAARGHVVLGLEFETMERGWLEAGTKMPESSRPEFAAGLSPRPRKNEASNADLRLRVTFTCTEFLISWLV